MTQKMWCLVNKNTGKIIKIWAEGNYVVGFSSKYSLLQYVNTIEHDEEIREIEFEY